MAEEFVNWSGSIRFTPSDRAQPKNTREVTRLVTGARKASRTLRPVGSGHSSQPVFNTGDTLVSLDSMNGVADADPEKHRARVLPGTGLHQLGRQLAKHGLAMENLGDVDYQTIAGAIGTATHGTGIALGNLSSTLIGGRLVNGLGEEVAFGVDAGEDREHDLLRAAQVSLGSLGILTSLTLRLEESYELHRQNWITHIDWVLENFAELIETNRSVDFYWYPRSDLAQVRMLNKPGEEPDLVPEGRLKEDRTGPSYEIIPNDRHLHFEEMEYMLPLDTQLEAFRQVRERVKTRHRATVGWRVLVRTIAPDRAMLSNAQTRPTMTIALLQNNTLAFQQYFDDLEPLFRRFGGRPHWGKKHSLKGAELYLEWGTFQRIRREMDPGGVFMNDYLRELFAETGE
ncbi:D-arabinono-1,4-lactone oxidase [Corynebacterium halotolerans]|uniref:Putative FAD/FMN-containing dehydrogenase n=1 Tax=Corynebacterium halotolerans YIM 70093 = DSM 44683 TaxID=1121362 RepID=M1NRC9_9CORY|nr:D-arabinono-1,4-lactone oxidase [Corynebacterium halotolerans]AGF72057.1 putative FAD/FMN-containing dehydrogenase [Corynebacterium halotolerans YIM 70093 = DSM 44683]